jgi:hypothetical protein
VSASRCVRAWGGVRATGEGDARAVSCYNGEGAVRVYCTGRG